MEVRNEIKRKQNKTYYLRIKNFEFSQKNIDLQVHDSIVLQISKHNESQYSSLYRDKNRLFLFYIQENNYEFPPLYQDSQATYQFDQPGTYCIQSYNYPKLRVQVNIAETRTQDNVTSTNIETTSQQLLSVDNFLTSEDNTSILSHFNNNDNKGLAKISRCLQLLNNGFSPESIKEKYQDVFVCTKNNQNTEIINKRKKSVSVKSVSNKSISVEKVSKKSEADEDFEDLRKVHQLNQLNPDCLFSLLTKIKRKYIKEDDDGLLKFDTIQKFSQYAKKNISVNYNLKKGYKLKTLKKYQNIIFDRFNQIFFIINGLKQLKRFLYSN